MLEISSTEPDCFNCGTRCYPGPAGQYACRVCHVIVLTGANHR